MAKYGGRFLILKTGMSSRASADGAFADEYNFEEVKMYAGIFPLILQTRNQTSFVNLRLEQLLSLHLTRRKSSFFSFRNVTEDYDIGR